MDDLAGPKVQYLRGDTSGPEIDSTRSASHRYIHTFYEDVEKEYRAGVFEFGL